MGIDLAAKLEVKAYIPLKMPRFPISPRNPSANQLFLSSDIRGGGGKPSSACTSIMACTASCICDKEEDCVSVPYLREADAQHDVEKLVRFVRLHLGDGNET